jgi:hypothetical protein
MRTSFSIQLFIFYSLFFIFSSVSASQGKDFLVTNTEDASFYNYTFNNFVFDVTLASGATSDTLNAFTVQQISSALEDFDFRNVILWSDAADPGFQGYWLDKPLGTMQSNNVCGCFYLNSLSEPIPSSGLRLFVSLEVVGGARDGRRVQFSLGKLDDKDSDGVFDLGESGVFVASKNNGPTDDAVVDVTSHRLTNRTNDGLPPLTVITSPAYNEVIYRDSFIIKGVAKDQGKSSPMTVDVIIDGNVFPVVAKEGGYATWEYEWKDIPDGKHTIKVQGSDFYGNSGVSSRALTITTDAKDYIAIDRSESFFSMKADLAKDEFISGVVSLRDEEGDPYSGAEVLVEQLTGPKITTALLGGETGRIFTDSSGNASIELRANETGAAQIAVVAVDREGRSYNMWSATVEFTRSVETPKEEPKPKEIPKTSGATVGSLQKLASVSTVYLVEGYVLLAIPSEDIFNAWGFRKEDIVEVSSFPSESIRRSPLKFPDGTLIKGTEAAVSVVTDHGKRAWIKNEATFLGLGYRWSDIQAISDGEIALYERIADIDSLESHPDGSLVKYPNDSRVFLLEDGNKRWVQNEEAFLANGFRFDQVITLSDDEGYPDGPSLNMDERFRRILRLDK